MSEFRTLSNDATWAASGRPTQVFPKTSRLVNRFPGTPSKPLMWLEHLRSDECGGVTCASSWGDVCLKFEKSISMTDDPNKGQNDPKQSGEQAGQQREQRSGQQQRNTDESSQKRPSQGRADVEQDQKKPDQGGQRRAS